MNSVITLIIFATLITCLCLCVNQSYACFFKASRKSTEEQTVPMPGPWNDKTYRRRLTDTDCECGQGFEKGDPPWNLYVNGSTDMICTATIITSNLVATSHECIRLEGHQMNIFDIWRKSSDSDSNFLDKNNIVVGTTLNQSEGEIFDVEEIIYNTKHIYNSMLGKYPEVDFLLLKLKADFTNHSILRPICLPEYSETLSFVHQIGKYYGAERYGRLLMDGNSTTVDVHEGVIITKDHCQAELLKDTMIKQLEDKDDDRVRPLCLRWINQYWVMPPIIQGGPLVITSDDRNDSFLAGIAIKTGSEQTTSGTDYAYFANILPLIKWIEYKASKHESRWCKNKVPLRLPKVPKGPNGRSTEMWVWEHPSAQKLFKARDESLDCVCGIQNTEISGRVVGGTEAAPREFGWMALIRLYHFGKGRGASFCGGAIINNRIILTAAHCVVNDKKIHSNSKSPDIDPSNVEVTLNAHWRNGDDAGIPVELEAVLFHPDYVTAKRDGYFDFDVALLVLKEALTFPVGVKEKGIRPICLPEFGVNISTAEKLVTVAGWGLTDPTKSGSAGERLQKIELPIIDLSQCRNLAKSKTTDNFICAGSLDRWHDAAAGDSGGPLKMKQGKQWVEVGLVSWGEDVHGPRGKIQTAALYTDVQRMLPFIDYYSKLVNAKWCKSQIPG